MNLNQPNFFNPRKNQVANDWQIWKAEFKVYIRLSNGYEKLSEEQRALLLLNLMGTKAHEALSQITFENPTSDQKDMDILLAKFDEFFDPPPNEVEQRFKFFSRRKSPNEDLDKYILDLKEKAAKCNFGHESEKFVIDMLILSMDDYLRKLIWESDVKTLSEIEQNFKQYNTTLNKMKELSETTKRNLNSENLGKAKSYDGEHAQKSTPAKRICSKCGENHPYKQCPAFDEICQRCFIKGHYTYKCKQTKSPNKESNIFKDEKNKARAMSSNEESKPSTSSTKQSEERHPEANKLQYCLRCNLYHLSEKCPHNETYTSSNYSPQYVCFNCKQNPHQHDCYYKNISTLPSTSCTKCQYNHGNHTCKYCVTCQVYGHCETECPRKSNRAHIPVQHTEQVRAQAQRPRQVPIHQPRQANPIQPRQNTRPQKHNKELRSKKNKDESDSCCIS